MDGDSESTNSKPASVDRLSLLWRRINEHKIVQWSVAYVAIAYAIQHAIILTSESLDWPNTVARVTMLLLAFGLPLVMTLAWYHGSLASKQVSKAEFSIIALLLAVGSLWFYTFVQPSKETADAARPTPAVQEAGVAAARSASLNPGGAISVAVLPFANVTGDASQDFFSDGMTDEISGALAKIPDLRVVARSSAFKFKGQNEEARVMGQALGATHLIEGSVRKAGNRVRISAELVQADSGLQVWSSSYDRELTDVFAIQEDIATAIAGAFHMSLGLKPGETLVHGTQNLGTYQEYLQAKAWFRDRNSARSGPFLATLESVVARDPGFAPGWAALSRAYAFQITASPAVPVGPVEEARRVVQSFRDKAEKAAQKAIQLDPQHPGGYWAMSGLLWSAGQWTAAEDMGRRGLALDPNDPDVLANYWNILLKTGHPKEALAVAEKVRALEPLVPAYDIQAAMIMQVTGRNEEAIAILKSVPTTAQTNVQHEYLARAYAAAGRYAEAADTLLEAASLNRNPKSQKALQDAAAVLRTAPKRAADPKSLPDFGVPAGDLIFVYAAVGAFDRVMDYPEREAQIRYMPDSGKTLWTPVMAPVRKTERFKAFARNAGYVDYWRAKGWPEFCHPVGADDFACN